MASRERRAAAWRALCAVLLALMWLGGFLRLPLHAAWLAASGAATLACLVIFVLRGKPAAGLIAWTIISAAYLALTMSIGDVTKVDGMPAAALLAYFCVTLLTGAEEAAQDAACAVIGAAYTVSGISKLGDGGAGWINDYSLRVLMEMKSFESTGALAALRSSLATSPALALSASFLTLALELSGAAMLSRRLRPYYAAALLCMHAGTYVGVGIIFWNWVMVVVLFGLLSPRALDAMNKKRAA